MFTIDELIGSIVENKILVAADFVHRKYGVLYVIFFESLVVGSPKDNELYFNALGGTIWAGLNEPADWGEKERSVSPKDRNHCAKYLDIRIEDLCPIQLCNGGRFLALRQLRQNCTFSTQRTLLSHPYNECQELTWVVNDISELWNQLDKVLRKLGVPLTNVFEIKNTIIKVAPRKR